MEFPPARKKNIEKSEMIQQPWILELCIHHVYTGPWASELDTALTQHWSDTDDTPHQCAGGMRTRMLLPFSSTSLCPSFLEDSRHLSAQILMWYILLNRVVVTRTQQGLAPLIIILHLEVIRSLRTDKAYGNPHKRLKEKGSSKASKHRCLSMAMEPLWSQGTARTKATLSPLKEGLLLGQ